MGLAYESNHGPTREEREAHVQKLHDAMEAAGDWEATCGRCGAAVKGTLQKIREHAEGCQG